MPRILTQEAVVTTVLGTLVTTAESVVVSSPLVRTFPDTCRVHVRAWAQVLTGGSTTSVTPRLRRGLLITDPLVGLANPENLKSAATGTEPFVFEASEDFQGRVDVQYSFTLQQAGAIANGNVFQAGIVVTVLGG